MNEVESYIWDGNGMTTQWQWQFHESKTLMSWQWHDNIITMLWKWDDYGIPAAWTWLDHDNTYVTMYVDYYDMIMTGLWGEYDMHDVTTTWKCRFCRYEANAVSLAPILINFHAISIMLYFRTMWTSVGALDFIRMLIRPPHSSDIFISF